MGSVKNVQGALVLILTITYISSSVTGRTLLGGRELHPIDICIFACDMCYKGEALISCANECITTEAVMGSSWSRTCKLFEQNGAHEGGVNPVNFMQ